MIFTLTRSLESWRNIEWIKCSERPSPCYHSRRVRAPTTNRRARVPLTNPCSFDSIKTQMVWPHQFVLNPDWEQRAEHLPSMCHMRTWHAAYFWPPSRTYSSHSGVVMDQYYTGCVLPEFGLKSKTSLRTIGTEIIGASTTPTTEVKMTQISSITPRVE